jgi:acyl-homoserine lactone acylase PvdQ
VPLLPGADVLAFIDIDSMQKRVYGYRLITGQCRFIQIGHTATMAWGHTVSTAFRFTPYQLTLVPGHPTEHLQNGNPVAMIRRAVTIAVKQSDGHAGALHPHCGAPARGRSSTPLRHLATVDNDDGVRHQGR